MKKILPFLLLIAAFLLQSCSIKTDTTYYKDAATSMESNIAMDAGTFGMMDMAGGNTFDDFKGLTTDWRSLYDIQKKGKIVINSDSAQVLKKLFLKLNKTDGKTTGIAIKYDKLMPQELAKLFEQSRQLRNMPLQDMAQWNGKTLTIDTEKFNTGNITQMMGGNGSDNATTPKSKQDSIANYGRQMAQGALGLMKMYNMTYTSTLKFQNPIKSISGKSDFVKKIDAHTVQVKVNTRELLDEGRKAENKDGKIIIETE